ncbi:MAG TPA: S-adenosylhomocysteine deaminase [Acetobacteraceae bacterium]|jgi:5-methylthioadenosine/S-adenosylhomocysteine deaminase|nr:S-adenosylhomocysteine deaminase [Acetobacteraceae bacterium]
MDRVIVSGGMVLVSGESSARRADLVLAGDSIAAIVPPDSAQGTRTIDASDRLIIPGLINAHTHGHGGLGKGVGDLWSLELLLNAGPWVNGGRSNDDRYLSTLLAAIEMIRKGCTACYDLSAMLPVPSVEALHDVSRAYADVGMRAVVSPMVADRSFYQAIPGLLDAFPPELRPMAEAMRTAPGDATLTPIREAARSWPFPTDQIRLGIAPTIPLHCSDDFMCGCRDLAAAYGLPLQTHLAESPVQRAGALKQYGTTLTAHLDRIGLLGPTFSGAHAIWIDDAEIELIARHGGALAHNPGSNLRLGNGIADMRRAIAGGVSVGVGTDGSSSSDNQNMFEAMRLSAYVSRVFDRPPEDWIGAPEALRLATEGSAAVLGMGDLIGRIAPGYKADLVFLDLDHINLVPLNNAVNQLVNTEDGAAVRDVMIGGRFVLKDGVLPGLDWPAIARRARDAAARLGEANAGARLAADSLAPVVSHFCVGLGRCAHDLPRKLAVY